MKMIIMGHHFSKNGRPYRLVIQVKYSDRVFFVCLFVCFCFCFVLFCFVLFFAVYRYRDGQHSKVYFEHPRTIIF